MQAKGKTNTKKSIEGRADKPQLTLFVLYLLVIVVVYFLGR